MHLTLLWMLLASGYALSPGTRPGTCRCGARREMLRGAAAAALLAVTPTPALADYGQAAGVKLPAFVPSPIRPTGEMAKTCEVVALGREDVCLEFKKVLSSYENMQLAKALEELEGSGSEVKGLVQGLLDTDWSGLQAKLVSPEVANLDVKALAAAVKKQDTGAATKAVLKLAKGV